MQLLSHRNDCHHPSRLVITMTHRRRYKHNVWSPIHALLINPINPTGYHLIIILLLIYYMCRFSEICLYYI